MISSHCRICGLYITVPDQFAGGKGACPRCKTALRIPRPLPEDHADFKEDLRYVAEPSQIKRAKDALAVVIPEEFGPCQRFDCAGCKMDFQSLAAPKFDPGQCPQCGMSNQPADANVPFTRAGHNDPVLTAEAATLEEGKPQGKEFTKEPVTVSAASEKPAAGDADPNRPKVLSESLGSLLDEEDLRIFEEEYNPNAPQPPQ